jgi:hypothetical protein
MYNYSLQIQSVLYNNEKIKLSCEAMILYALMLDRFSLSVANNWKDKDGKIYILCSIKDAQKTVLCSRDKMMKVFKELRDKGLIFKKRQGRCRPDMIYINEKFLYDDNLPSAMSEISN